MYAVADINGFQYRLEKGQVLKVPTCDVEVGGKISISNVLLIADGEKTVIGNPFVGGSIVEATVKSHGRGEKIFIFKKKRRKDYCKKTGHRQNYTEILIDSIKVG
jgi:large subunit ribosomal protein L21